MHKHRHAHDHVFQFCDVCDVVYCTKCDDVWAKPIQISFPQPAPYFPYPITVTSTTTN